MDRFRPGFTLFEILVVVILLGILAAIVIPKYWGVTTEASTTNLRENLSKIRAHIQVYRNQHARYPDGDRFAAQMTQATHFNGEVSEVRDADHPYGPYLEQMPANPVSSQRTIRVASSAAVSFSPPAADGGWWYNEVTGEFRADLTDRHVDADGTPFSQY